MIKEGQVIQVQNDIAVNINNLSSNLVLNYKQLTELLSIKYYAGGNAKKSQLDLLSCYVDYIKKGTKFYIKKVHDEKVSANLLKKRADKIARKNDGLYIKYIELILLNELSKTNGNTFSLTPKKLYKLLGMANDKYFYKNYELGTDQEIEADRIRFVKNQVPLADNSDINDFFIRTNDKFRKTLSDSLKSLKSRRLIDYQEQRIIVLLPDTNSYGYSDIIVADDYQLETILKAERTVLDSFGLNRVEHVYLTKRTKEFYSKVSEIINEYGWDYYYKQIKIVYNQKNTENYISKLENEIVKLKSELNNELIASLNKQIDKKYDAGKSDLNSIESGVEEDSFLLGSYITIQKELLEKFVRIDSDVNK